MRYIQQHRAFQKTFPRNQSYRVAERKYFILCRKKEVYLLKFKKWVREEEFSNLIQTNCKQSTVSNILLHYTNRLCIWKGRPRQKLFRELHVSTEREHAGLKKSIIRTPSTICRIDARYYRRMCPAMQYMPKKRIFEAYLPCKILLRIKISVLMVDAGSLSEIIH